MKYIAIIAALGSLVSAGKMQARVPQDPTAASTAAPAGPTAGVNPATMKEIMDINEEFTFRMCLEMVQILNDTAFRFPEDFKSQDGKYDYCLEKSGRIYWQVKDMKDKQNAKNGGVS